MTDKTKTELLRENMKPALKLKMFIQQPTTKGENRKIEENSQFMSN